MALTNASRKSDWFQSFPAARSRKVLHERVSRSGKSAVSVQVVGPAGLRL